MFKWTSLLCVLVLMHSASAAVLSPDDEKYNLLAEKIAELYSRDAANQQKIEALSHELAQYRSEAGNQVSTTTRAQQNVAFHAIVSPHYTDHIPAGTRVRFDLVFTNHGGGYQPGTGMFVAPVNGTYVISVTLSGRKTDGTTSYYMIMAGDVLRAKLISHTLQQDAQTLVLPLKAGDTVYVSTEEGDNGILGVYYSSFSGFLLYGDM